MARKSREQSEALEYFSRALKLSFYFLKALVAILVISYLLSGFFTVKQDEVAVVLRWGKIKGVGEERVLKPGFHWSFPEPVDKVVRIPVKKVKSIELRTFWDPDLDKKNVNPAPFLIPWLHGYLITGDNNIIHTLWHIEYQIDDPILYLTNTSQEESIIKIAVSNAIVRVGGRLSVDEALRTRLETFSRLVKNEAQKTLDEVDSGLTLVAVYLDRSVPPLQVADAFNKVIKSEQIKSARINEAKSYANRVVNTAMGEAARIVGEANTYRSEVVNEARADAEYIEKLTQKFGEGSKGLNVYLAYFYQEKIEEILANLQNKFILKRPFPGKENELRIILGKRQRWKESK